jgi:hypothetical protein
MGGFESKPRDLGSDRGYRVATAGIFGAVKEKPHPLKTKKNCGTRRNGCRTEDRCKTMAGFA